jgi:hypothetical protein
MSKEELEKNSKKATESWWSKTPGSRRLKLRS